VLLISDGLEREADAGWHSRWTGCHRSCRRLIWLNPLLRYGGFEAKAQGIKMMLPHVDEFAGYIIEFHRRLIAALSAGPARHDRSLDPNRSLKSTLERGSHAQSRRRHSQSG